jgi:hypothetical protein
MIMDNKGVFALLAAALAEQTAKYNMELQHSGYYRRYTGHSKTFKKNRRKGL